MTDFISKLHGAVRELSPLALSSAVRGAGFTERGGCVSFCTRKPRLTVCFDGGKALFPLAFTAAATLKRRAKNCLILAANGGFFDVEPNGPVLILDLVEAESTRLLLGYGCALSGGARIRYQYPGHEQALTAAQKMSEIAVKGITHSLEVTDNEVALTALYYDPERYERLVMLAAEHATDAFVTADVAYAPVFQHPILYDKMKSKLSAAQNPTETDEPRLRTYSRLLNAPEILYARLETNGERTTYKLLADYLSAITED